MGKENMGPPGCLKTFERTHKIGQQYPMRDDL